MSNINIPNKLLFKLAMMPDILTRLLKNIEEGNTFKQDTPFITNRFIHDVVCWEETPESLKYWSLISYLIEDTTLLKDNLINLTLPEALDFVKQSYPTTYQQILPLLIERNLVEG